MQSTPYYNYFYGFFIDLEAGRGAPNKCVVENVGAGAEKNVAIGAGAKLAPPKPNPPNPPATAGSASIPNVSY